jgi:hypothetical protein
MLDNLLLAYPPAYGLRADLYASATAYSPGALLTVQIFRRDHFQKLFHALAVV